MRTVVTDAGNVVPKLSAEIANGRTTAARRAAVPATLGSCQMGRKFRLPPLPLPEPPPPHPLVASRTSMPAPPASDVYRI